MRSYFKLMYLNIYWQSSSFFKTKLFVWIKAENIYSQARDLLQNTVYHTEIENNVFLLYWWISQMRLILAGPLSFTMMNICKYTAIVLKSRELCESILWIANDWREIKNIEERNIMLRSSKTARTFTTFCVIFMYSGGMPFSTIFTFTQDPIVVGNVSYRQLAYASYFAFFNPQVSLLLSLIDEYHRVDFLNSS